MSEKDQLVVPESDHHGLHEATAATAQTFLQTPPEQLFFNSSALACSVPRRRSGVEGSVFCTLTTSPTSTEAGHHVVHPVGPSLLEKPTKQAVAKITTCGRSTLYYSLGPQKVREVPKNVSPTEPTFDELLFPREKQTEGNWMPKQTMPRAEEDESSGIRSADVETKKREEGSKLSETGVPCVAGVELTGQLYVQLMTENNTSSPCQITVDSTEEECKPQPSSVSEYSSKLGVGDWGQQPLYESVKKEKKWHLPTPNLTLPERELVGYRETANENLPPDGQRTDESVIEAEIYIGQSLNLLSEGLTKDGPPKHHPATPWIFMSGIHPSVVYDPGVNQTIDSQAEVTHLKVPNDEHQRSRRIMKNVAIEGVLNVEEGDMDSVAFLEDFTLAAVAPGSSLESHLGENEGSDEKRNAVKYLPLGGSEKTTGMLGACCSYDERQLVASYDSTTTYRLPTMTLQASHHSVQHSGVTSTLEPEKEKDEQMLRSLYLVVPQLAPGELESVSVFPLSDRDGDSTGRGAIVHIVPALSNLCVGPQTRLHLARRVRLESMESLGLVDCPSNRAQSDWNLRAITLRRLRTLCLSSLWHLMQASRGVFTGWMVRLFPRLSQNAIGYENPVDRNSSNAETTTRDSVSPSLRLLVTFPKLHHQLSPLCTMAGWTGGYWFRIERAVGSSSQLRLHNGTRPVRGHRPRRWRDRCRKCGPF
ncbi:unnamed protein product [Schistocephalus solidus]|uniref:Microtubule-associated tumor suppressor candidate 2 n=1 Tax=Schistocephalus solidus TaxID=70667 RepID=A0A183SFX5_SCHSO|nr:unnamed protein product [Schistocephalus solidus]